MLTKITFDLADPAGILYFANVFHLAHKNIENYLDKEFGLWDEWFNNKNHGAPIKHTECNYSKPMILGKDYNIESKPVKKTDSTITFNTQFLDLNGGICAEVKTVHVFVSKPDMKKINVPESLASKLF